MNDIDPRTPGEDEPENVAPPREDGADEEVIPPGGVPEKPLEEGDTFEKVFLHGRHMGF